MKQYNHAGGTVTISEHFPKKVRQFPDLPTGVVSISCLHHSGTEIERMPLYYAIDLLRPKYRRDVEPLTIVTGIIEALRMYAVEIYPTNPTRLNGIKRIEKDVAWLVNPAAVKGTNGTPSVIHSGSSSADGFNKFELYFPRGLQFVMWGDFGEGSRTVMLNDDSYFTGKVDFNGRAHHFRLKPQDAAHFNSRPATKIIGDRSWVKNHIVAVMSKEDAAVEMRRYIELYFPFIKDHNMLGEFIFD